MAQIYETQSCAVDQIHTLPDVTNGRKPNFKAALFDLFDNWLREDYELHEDCDYPDLENEAGEEQRIVELDEDEIKPFYVMTQSHVKGKASNGWVWKFADWIEKQNLGFVTRSAERHNPNHRYVTVFVWAVNRDELIKWLKENY